ncbi:MAG: calcium-binding protein, partial [Rhodospirillaceae bacterium]|nr:calcium-binding protein [Rhodospirillaceae bacterium]MBT4674005.1 calcium-binding protein [Rhodospirillaceae bacterium]MBT4717966.1 calcium-binding protein [Rhodospirillaceae bacterium]
FVGESSVRVQLDAFELVASSSSGLADGHVDATFPVRVALDDADVGSTVALFIDGSSLLVTPAVTQDDLDRGYLNVTATHAGADGSSHAITSQLTTSDGTQSPVSNAYTVTIGAGGSVVSVIEGTSGDDTLYGTADDDVFYGYDGDDSFYSSFGNDTFDGGEGDDDGVYYTHSFGDNTGHSEGVNIDLATGQVTDSSGKTDTLIDIEKVIGSPHDDVMVGSDGDELLIGGDGSDRITGGAGNDDLEGGAGNDTYIASLGTDTIEVGTGVDIFKVELGDLFFEGAEMVVADGDANYNDLRFYLYDDVALTSATTTVLDHLVSALTTLVFDFDEDGVLDQYTVATVFDNSANTTDDLAIAGTALDDTLANGRAIKGGDGDDILTGNAGADELDGGAGDDWIEGGEGLDSIIGGTHGTFGDTISFHSGTQAVAIDLSTNTITNDGYGNADTVSGIENIEGSELGDSLNGDTGVNFLFGLEGDDTLIGGGGGDTFEGEGGADTMTGGAGVDRFIYESSFDSGTGAGNFDTITNFNANAEDIFDISAFAQGTFAYIGDYTTGNEGTAAFSGGTNTSARFNSTTKLLEIDADGDAVKDMEIQLDTTNATNLDTTDFDTTGI